MKKLLLGILIGGAGRLCATSTCSGPSVAVAEQERAKSRTTTGRSTAEELADTGSAATNFSCDGRTHCSQMTSCEEAMYFLENCPGVKMDGEGDGIPCERQWCGSR